MGVLLLCLWVCLFFLIQINYNLCGNVLIGKLSLLFYWADSDKNLFYYVQNTKIVWFRSNRHKTKYFCIVLKRKENTISIKYILFSQRRVSFCGMSFQQTYHFALNSKAWKDHGAIYTLLAFNTGKKGLELKVPFSQRNNLFRLMTAETESPAFHWTVCHSHLCCLDLFQIPSCLDVLFIHFHQASLLP